MKIVFWLCNWLKGTDPLQFYQLYFSMEQNGCVSDMYTESRLQTHPGVDESVFHGW